MPSHDVKPRLVSGVSGEGVTAILREAYALVRRRKAIAQGVTLTCGDGPNFPAERPYPLSLLATARIGAS